MQGNTDAAQADLDTAASLGADTTAAEETLAALTPEPTPESTAAPEEEKIEHPREFRFTTGVGGTNGDFLYDEDGRLTHITLGIYDDFTKDYDISIDYADGKATADFDAAQVATTVGTPLQLEVTNLTLKEDGTPDTLSAYVYDSVAYIEFNENGQPSYFTVTQDDVGYQITYTPPRWMAALPWTAPSASMGTWTTTSPNRPTTSSRPLARFSTNNLLLSD